VATDFLLYFIGRFMYLFSNWTACRCALKCALAQVTALQFNFAVSRGCRNLATRVILAALNGNEGGQNKQVSLTHFLTTRWRSNLLMTR